MSSCLTYSVLRLQLIPPRSAISPGTLRETNQISGILTPRKSKSLIFGSGNVGLRSHRFPWNVRRSQPRFWSGYFTKQHASYMCIFRSTILPRPFWILLMFSQSLFSSLPKMFLVCIGSSPAPDWRCAHIQDRNQMLVIHFIWHTCLPSCWCCSSRDSVGRVVICSPSIWNKNYDYAGSNNNATDHDGSNINMIQLSNYSVWMARGGLTLCISCAHRGSLAPVGGHMGPQDCSQHL